MLDWSVWATPRSDCFIPGKDSRYIEYSRLGGTQERSERGWRRENLLPPTVFEPRNVQTVASRTTPHPQEKKKTTEEYDLHFIHINSNKITLTFIHSASLILPFLFIPQTLK